MKIVRGTDALIATLFLASCYGDASPRGFATYRPPLLPVRIVADNTGVRIEGETSLVTFLGEFGIGADVPLVRAPDALRVVIRDRRSNTDEVFDVKWADTLDIILNGRNRLNVTNGMVILDISPGGSYELTINAAREADSRTIPITPLGTFAAEAPTARKGFEMTVESHSSHANLAAVCRSTFGSEFRLADWSDIQQALRQGVPAEKIFSEGSVSITRGGDAYWGGGRHYIASRPIHDGYLVHEWSHGGTYALGSWSAAYPVLCFAP